MVRPKLWEIYKVTLILLTKTFRVTGNFKGLPSFCFVLFYFFILMSEQTFCLKKFIQDWEKKKQVNLKEMNNNNNHKKLNFFKHSAQ